MSAGAQRRRRIWRRGPIEWGAEGERGDGGMEVADAKRLRALEEKNRELKRLVAKLMLDVKKLRLVLSKTF